ncbi:ankyrin repeat domain-containing protein [uncultured Roseivirga sp.]|uniref:ankyrin repeat domain-containing protein n=1 Tax=uncultured Roseivirga sp. TaxID=543088 RepID=UPI0030DD6DE9|tara:strand:+ start:38300 stop:38800 length:501 start_codon:yes stop_codon:yes gene_type:complete
MGKGGRPHKVHEELTQLRQFVEQADKNSIETILQNHGIDAYDEDKRTALIWASFFGQVNIVKWLIEGGANPNFQDRIGYTGLHFCAQEQNTEVAKLLLEKGADPNVMDQHGNSPLWTALFNAKGNFENIKALRSHGADPSLKNIHDRSPNDMAKSIYEKEIDELIK